MLAKIFDAKIFALSHFGNLFVKRAVRVGGIIRICRAGIGFDEKVDRIDQAVFITCDLAVTIFIGGGVLIVHIGKERLVFSIGLITPVLHLLVGKIGDLHVLCSRAPVEIAEAAVVGKVFTPPSAVRANDHLAGIFRNKVRDFMAQKANVVRLSVGIIGRNSNLRSTRRGNAVIARIQKKCNGFRFATRTPTFIQTGIYRIEQPSQTVAIGFVLDQLPISHKDKGVCPFVLQLGRCQRNRSNHGVFGAVVQANVDVIGLVFLSRHVTFGNAGILSVITAYRNAILLVECRIGISTLFDGHRNRKGGIKIGGEIKEQIISALGSDRLPFTHKLDADLFDHKLAHFGSIVLGDHSAHKTKRLQVFFGRFYFVSVFIYFAVGLFITIARRVKLTNGRKTGANVGKISHIDRIIVFPHGIVQNSRIVFVADRGRLTRFRAFGLCHSLRQSRRTACRCAIGRCACAVGRCVCGNNSFTAASHKRQKRQPNRKTE